MTSVGSLLTLNVLYGKEKRLHRKAKTTNNVHDWLRFRTLRNEIITNIRQAKEQAILDVASSLLDNRNSKYWWSTLNSFLSTPNRHIPPIETNNTILYEEPDKANAFNDYVAEQTKLQADASAGPTPPLYQLNSTLSNIHLTPHELELILRSLPLGKAVGPDLVNNRILKELVFELSVPLSNLFKVILYSYLILKKMNERITDS